MPRWKRPTEPEPLNGSRGAGTLVLDARIHECKS